jgi:hypothetical protein
VFEPIRALAIAALTTCLGITVATASAIQVTLDTSALAGTAAQLAFDFIEGGTPSNSVTITGFSTDGTLGGATLTGDVTGALPGTVTLSDSNFFNEYLLHIALGNSISFTFETTDNPPDDPSFPPDSFSFFLIDPTTGLSLIETSDPTGANSLLLYSIGVASPLRVYDSDQVTISAASTAPEPAPALLMLVGLLVWAAFPSWRSLNRDMPVR